MQVMPFSIVAFEVERWLLQQSRERERDLLDASGTTGRNGNAESSAHPLQSGPLSSAVSGLRRQPHLAIQMVHSPSMSSFRNREHDGGSYGSEPDRLSAGHRGNQSARSSLGSLDDLQLQSNVASWVSAHAAACNEAGMAGREVDAGGGASPGAFEISISVQQESVSAAEPSGKGRSAFTPTPLVADEAEAAGGVPPVQRTRQRRPPRQEGLMEASLLPFDGLAQDHPEQQQGSEQAVRYRRAPSITVQWAAMGGCLRLIRELLGDCELLNLPFLH